MLNSHTKQAHIDCTQTKSYVIVVVLSYVYNITRQLMTEEAPCSNY